MGTGKPQSEKESGAESWTVRMLSRRDFLKAGLMTGACSVVGGVLPDVLFAADEKSGKRRPNILFIAVDDLRPELGCYGVGHIKTPNIDALAQRGTAFNRAYCQQAVCSPSRTSLLTGRRPDTCKVYDLRTHFRLHLPDVVTLPQYFKQHGYHTQSFGKIYHGGLDDPVSWSAASWWPKGQNYGKPETLAAIEEERKRVQGQRNGPYTEVMQKDPKTGVPLKLSRPKRRIRGPSWEDPDVPDNALRDGETADKAIETLRQVKDEQFFLAVGFYKPHLPFVAPKKYFNLYPRDKIGLPDNYFPPEDVPQIALHNWGELRNYSDIPKQGPLAEKQAIDLIRAYYAATSYTDAQVGRVMDELRKLGLRDNTVIVLWGDHGWHLGDHSLWCKHTNFEVAARSPLIFSAPGQKNPGARTDALAEFVDVYPTLCDLCDLPIPEGLEGSSLAPVMDDPRRPWKEAAFSQYPRSKVAQYRAMGYSMRTDRYRYTEWQNRDTGKAMAVELYDYETDPMGNVNIAGLPEKRELVAKLAKMLHAGWRAALPPGVK